MDVDVAIAQVPSTAREVPIFIVEVEFELKKQYVLYLRKRWDDWQSGSIRSNLDFYWIEEVVLFICLKQNKNIKI